LILETIHPVKIALIVHHRLACRHAGKDLTVREVGVSIARDCGEPLKCSCAGLIVELGPNMKLSKPVPKPPYGGAVRSPPPKSMFNPCVSSFGSP
jgi:hypothetical protein